MKKFYSLLLSLLVLTCAGVSAQAAEVWKLVTSESELAAGDQLIIAATVDGSSYAMSNASSTNYRISMDATINADELTYADDMMILELGGESGSWTLKTVNYAGTSQGFIGNSSTSSNNCTVSTTTPAGTGFVAKITFTDNVPTITFNSTSRNVLKYNASSPRFSCYTSGQKDISIYKKTEAGDVAASVATPTFSTTGLVEVGTKVSISCATEGAAIYYTLDETDPTTASTLYAEPIEITENVTIKAIAVKEGLENSKIAIATLNVPVMVDNIAALLKANESLNGSNKETSTSIFQFANPVTAIYQNGSNLYVKDNSGYLLIFGSLGKTYNNGDVIPAGIRGKVQNYYTLFELTEVDAATFQAGTAGTPVEPIAISIDDVNAEAVSSYVKLEGVTVAGMANTKTNFTITDPALDSTITGRNNFTIDAVNGENLTVYGFTVKYNNDYQIYPIEITTASGKEIVAAPTFSPAAGDVLAGTEVTIACDTEGASIYYTLDESEPTTSSALYSDPIVIDQETTIKAIAVKDGMENSAVATATYTIKVPADATFNFSAPATLTPAYPANNEDESLGADGNNKQAIVSDITFTKGNVAVTSTKGSTDAKIYYQSTGAIQLRVYNGGSTTVKSLDPGNNITKIVITYNNGTTSSKNVTAPAVGTWVAADGTWTGNAQEVTFAYTGTQQINAIDVYCAQGLTGVDDVVADDANAPVEYYNLQGVRVENPENGLYIKRQGSTVTKVIIR